MNILHLVLFSNSYEYDLMYNITSKFYKKIKNVKTIYYTFSDKIDKDYMLKDDILYIYGVEVNLLTILDKTIKAFMYFENKLSNYKYIVRSNISTIVNFYLLYDFLHRYNYHYIGAKLDNLMWLDYKSGIYDDKYFNTNYYIGYCIIFSSKMIKILIKNKNLLDYSVVDDVSFGIFIKKYYNNLILEDIFKDKLLILDDKTVINENKKYYFYRNKSLNRLNDVINMDKICKIL